MYFYNVPVNGITTGSSRLHKRVCVCAFGCVVLALWEVVYEEILFLG